MKNIHLPLTTSGNDRVYMHTHKRPSLFLIDLLVVEEHPCDHNYSFTPQYLELLCYPSPTPNCLHFVKINFNYI